MAKEVKEVLREALSELERICDERDAMARQLDQVRVQLAGCGVAALGGTRPEQVAKCGDFGWSPAYEDTLLLRRKYEALLDYLGHEGGLPSAVQGLLAAVEGKTYVKEADPREDAFWKLYRAINAAPPRSAGAALSSIAKGAARLAAEERVSCAATLPWQPRRTRLQYATVPVLDAVANFLRDLGEAADEADRVAGVAGEDKLPSTEQVREACAEPEERPHAEVWKLQYRTDEPAIGAKWVQVEAKTTFTQDSVAVHAPGTIEVTRRPATPDDIARATGESPDEIK